MLSVGIRRWAAWAPGLEARDDWERWCRAPVVLGCEGSPAVAFLPPLLRRRCSRLTRMMLHAAYAAGGPEELAALPTVFASRYGEMATTVALLDRLARKEPLSATAFTHSVHNTQLGLFSIATKNSRMGSALAGGADTFSSAIIEGLGMTERAGGGATLVVVGDDVLPTELGAFQDEPPAAYAAAFVIERTAGHAGLCLSPAQPSAVPEPPRWPQAIEFLRWLMSKEPSLTLGAGPAWTWTRRACTPAVTLS